jgi:hypothetical protein
MNFEWSYMCEYIFWIITRGRKRVQNMNEVWAWGNVENKTGVLHLFHEIFPYALQRRWDLIHLNVMLVGWEDCRSISRLVSVRRT